jgi:hypothetical protein
MTLPYYGLTGITRATDMERLRTAISRSSPLDRQVMIGMLVSNKSINGETLDPKWQKRYPDVRTADAIWSCPSESSDDSILKTVHYNSKAGDLALQLDELLGLIPSLQAIQLNISHPSIIEMTKFRSSYAHVPVILQIGSKVLDEFEEPSNLRNYLQPYQSLVEWVLIDPSGGVGKPFDKGQAMALLSACDWTQLGMIPGIAGGLSPHNLSRLTPFLRLWPNLCWDAEGLLMQTSGGTLDVERAVTYLDASRRLLD